MPVVEVEIPEDVVAALRKSLAEIAWEMRRAAAERWCAEGLISRDRAAEISGPSPAPPPPRYALVLFGNPTVRRLGADGREVEILWRLRRAFQTVAFLALAPDRRATKDEVIEAVWPDASIEAIRKNFHPTLSEARRALENRGAIVFRQGSYLLSPELVWEVDALRFERLIAEGREVPGSRDAEALEVWLRAWRLYRGPLLAGLDSAWILPRRESLRRAYLRLLSDIGKLAERLGRESLALDAYRSVLLEEPYEERIHLAMMELYARQGRRDLVRRQYVKLQDLLLRELGEEPLEETQERYHRLMR